MLSGVVVDATEDPFWRYSTIHWEILALFLVLRKTITDVGRGLLNERVGAAGSEMLNLVSGSPQMLKIQTYEFVD